MTDKEKNQIAIYRNQGMSYTQISKKMDLSINAVKTYCKRHGLGGLRAYEVESNTVITVCEQCGQPVKQNPGRKQKRFCSDKCRNAWWNDHMDLVKKKANYECICEKCGKPFVSYGNKNRKYCSHECYIEDRFGGAR
ncbi:MAG: RNA polymerase subunit sigma-70 [Dorea sp.]|nr:RNA polymerase subunit sigma-70 [Dorea sp.]